MRGRAQLTQRLTAKEFASLKGVRGVNVVGGFGNETLFLAPNWRVPPFDNVKLRQAMAYAINYIQLIDIGYSGAARRWVGPWIAPYDPQAVVGPPSQASG